MLPVVLNTLLYGDNRGPTKRPARFTERCVECDKPTKGGKPWCTAHVMMSPYAANLANEMDKRDDELERVRKYGRAAIKADSQILKDIIALLQAEGSKTLPRLGRDLKGVDLPELMHYAMRLRNQNKVSLAKNSRGAWVVHLVGYVNPFAHLEDDEEDDEDE